MWHGRDVALLAQQEGGIVYNGGFAGLDKAVVKYGYISILYTRGSIYPKEYLIAIPEV